MAPTPWHPCIRPVNWQAHGALQLHPSTKVPETLYACFSCACAPETTAIPTSSIRESTGHTPATANTLLRIRLPPRHAHAVRKPLYGMRQLVQAAGGRRWVEVTHGSD